MFSADDAETLKAQGRRVILVRVETSPEDIHGMHAAEGILTTRVGMTSQVYLEGGEDLYVDSADDSIAAAP